MLGWHHQLDRHEFEEALEVGDGQGSLACYSPWSGNELDTAKHAHTLILQHRLVKPLKTCSFKKTRTNFANYKLYIDSKTYDMILAHSSLS